MIGFVHGTYNRVAMLLRYIYTRRYSYISSPKVDLPRSSSSSVCRLYTVGGCVLCIDRLDVSPSLLRFSQQQQPWNFSRTDSSSSRERERVSYGGKQQRTRLKSRRSIEVNKVVTAARDRPDYRSKGINRRRPRVHPAARHIISGFIHIHFCFTEF